MDEGHDLVESPPPDLSAQRAASARRARKRRAGMHAFWTYAGLAVGAAVVLFPIYVLVVDSLLSPNQLAANPPKFLPTTPQWHNYSDVFSKYGFGGYMKNSFIMTGIIVAAQLVTSVLAAYAFVFLRFPLRRTLFLLVLATVMIPFEITVASNYTTVQDLGWQGNFLGLTVPFLATGFGIFLIRQAFLQIPKELREAAVIDGYGPMRFLWRIAIPLARPVIAALAVFSFLGAWNQYLWPALLTNNNQAIRTIQIGLSTISGGTETIGTYLAGAVVSLVPLLILLIFFRKNLIRSLTAGAVK
jgi:sn-glycerol 3-phosphate transport system permease protein